MEKTTQKHKTAKPLIIRKEPLLSQKMRQMKVGDVGVIYAKDHKISSVKTASSRLKKKGYLFKVSEAGMIGKCEVTRIQ